MEHKVVDEIECRSSVKTMQTQIETLENRLERDHKRLEEDHEKLENMVDKIKNHNADQDNRAQRLKERMKDLEVQTKTCIETLTADAEERRMLNEKFMAVANDVALIKRDMERVADTKKHTFQHIMSIIGPVVTAALILWLGLGS